jgi:hypothetical protein
MRHIAHNGTDVFLQSFSAVQIPEFQHGIFAEKSGLCNPKPEQTIA